MAIIKQIISHILNGLLNLAELFDKSVEGLVKELDSSEEEKPTRRNTK